MPEHKASWKDNFPALSQFLARDKESDGPVYLDRRRAYILPTVFGLWYGIFLIAILIGSINYSLSLGYVLSFLLAGMFFTCMLDTYRNLLGLRITCLGADNAFAGSEARFKLELAAGMPRLAIKVEAKNAAPVWVDVEGSTQVSINIPATQRGYLKPGRFTLSCVYPLGLFRAWGYAAFPHAALVYPAPDDSKPDADTAGDESVQKRTSDREGSEDFAGLRAWHPGDSPRHVAWRTAARTGVMATKRFSDVEGGTLDLDWNQLTGLDTEARLSRLTRWVLEADKAGVRYALHIPGRSIAAGQGPQHRGQCLEALALFELPAS